MTEQKLELIKTIRRYEEAYNNSVKIVRARMKQYPVIPFSSPMIDVIQFYRDKLRTLRKELETLDAQ